MQAPAEAEQAQAAAPAPEEHIAPHAHASAAPAQPMQSDEASEPAVDAPASPIESPASAPAAVLDDLAHIAATDAVPPPNPTLLSLEAKLRAQEEELVQLRAAVLAARGSRGVLPPGWDDEAPAEQEAEMVGDDAVEGEAAVQDVAETAAPPAEVASAADDAAARSMLNRALVSIGEAPISAAAPAAAASSDSSDSDSDSSDSDSDSDSSSSSSSSESEAGGKKKRPRAMMSDDESDDEAGRSGPRDPFSGPTTANEAIEPPPEPLPFEKVAEHVELRPLGHILSIVDSVVIVAQDVARKQPGSEAHQQQQARPRPRDQAGREGEGEGEYSVLDSGSTLAFEDRTVLGVVYETFGSVLAPLYSLRFKSADDVQRVGVTIGRAVLYDPASSVYVLTRQLRQEKGSDASNLHDEEVDAHERDFSDDEAEAAARAARKKGGAAGKKRAEKRKGNEGDGGYQQRGNGRTGGLPSRPDFDAPLSNGNAGGPSRAEGRAMPLPYDEPSAWTPAPSTSAVSALPLRVAAGLSAQSERAASQGSSNGVAKAGLPLSRPAGLPAKPQVSWDSAEPAGSPSSANASPALAQAQPPQPPPIFLTGEAPPPGAHINPLFAHQWQQQAQSTGAYQYAAPHAQQQPYYAQPQQRWPGAQPQQQQWSQNYGQYGQHAALPPQQQQQAWGWNAAQQQQQPQVQGQQQQDYAAYDPQQPGTQWGAAAWGQAQGSPQQPRPPQ